MTARCKDRWLWKFSLSCLQLCFLENFPNSTMVGGGHPCVVCHKRKDTHPQFSYHRFPKDIEKCQKWKDALGIPSILRLKSDKLHESYRVCSQHFSPQNYLTSTRLAHHAYPDQDLPETSGCDIQVENSADITTDLVLGVEPNKSCHDLEAMIGGVDHTFGTLEGDAAVQTHHRLLSDVAAHNGTEAATVSASPGDRCTGVGSILKEWTKAGEAEDQVHELSPMPQHSNVSQDFLRRHTRMAQSSRQQVKVKVPAMGRVSREGRGAVLARLPSLRAPRDLTLSASSTGLLKPSLAASTKNTCPGFRKEGEEPDASSQGNSHKLTRLFKPSLVTTTTNTFCPTIKTEREEPDASSQAHSDKLTRLLKPSLSTMAKNTCLSIKTEREEPDDSSQAHSDKLTRLLKPSLVTTTTTTFCLTIKTEREEPDASSQAHSDKLAASSNGTEPSLRAPQDLTLSASSTGLFKPSLMTTTNDSSCPSIKMETEDIKIETWEADDSHEDRSDHLTACLDRDENGTEGNAVQGEEKDFLQVMDPLVVGGTAGPTLRRGSPGNISGLIGDCNGVFWQEAEELDGSVSGQDKQQYAAAARRGFSGHKKKQPTAAESSNNGEEFKCLMCGKVMSTFGSLLSHTRRHAGIRTYECKECGKGFISSSDLTKHRIMHTGVRDYKCVECGKEFFSINHLNRHTLIHTGVRKYKCMECGKKFLRKCHLSSHARTHTGEKYYECLQCGKQFSRKYELDAHIQSHHRIRIFECEVYKKNLIHESDLQSHSLIHSGVKNCECPKCGKKFRRPSYLKSHTLTHTGKKKHKCEECGKRFRFRFSLNLHMQRHSGLREFKCDVCGRLFKTKQDIARHLKTHT